MLWLLSLAGLGSLAVGVVRALTVHFGLYLIACAVARKRSRHRSPAPWKFVHAFSRLVNLLLNINSRGICLDSGSIHHFFSSRPIHASVVDSLGRVIRGFYREFSATT